RALPASLRGLVFAASERDLLPRRPFMSVVELESRELAIEGAAGGGLWADAWSRLRRNPGAIVGFCLVAAFVVIAAFAPLIAPFDPRAQDLSLIQNGCCPGPSS